MLDFSYGAIEEFKKGNFDWGSITKALRKGDLTFHSKVDANADRERRLREALFRGWISEEDAFRFI